MFKETVNFPNGKRVTPFCRISWFFFMSLQIFLYQGLAGLMILGEEERLLTGRKKSASEESWTRDWGGGKSSVPFPRYPLVGLPLSLHSPFFPNKKPGPRSKNFYSYTPGEGSFKKGELFQKKSHRKLNLSNWFIFQLRKEFVQT